MSIHPDTITIGQCYLTETGRIRRVTALPPGRVQFQQRAALNPSWRAHKTDILDLRSFAFCVERPVPSNWTPETDD